MYKISIYGCAMFKKLVCQWLTRFELPAYSVVSVDEVQPRFSLRLLDG